MQPWLGTPVRRMGLPTKGKPAAAQRNGKAPAERSNDRSVLRSLSRGLQVLSLFDSEHQEWTLDEVTKHTGFTRMTVWRMLRTLEAANYVVRDPITSLYHLGPAMLVSMYLTWGFAALMRAARPYLEALSRETEEPVTLAVEIDGAAVSVDSVDSSRFFRREMALGRIIGDTANAHGKVFAAFKSPAERELIIARPHPQMTVNTITDPTALRYELERVFDEGVAVDIEERNIGTCAVAAPVFDQVGCVVATLGVLVPTGRFGPEERQKCAQAVRASAASLSAFLGYSPTRPTKAVQTMPIART
jgi:IclR family KDG regulon transcriptional repressor